MHDDGSSRRVRRAARNRHLPSAAARRPKPVGSDLRQAFCPALGQLASAASFEATGRTEVRQSTRLTFLSSSPSCELPSDPSGSAHRSRATIEILKEHARAFSKCGYVVVKLPLPARTIRLSGRLQTTFSLLWPWQSHDLNHDPGVQSALRTARCALSASRGPGACATARQITSRIHPPHRTASPS